MPAFKWSELKQEPIDPAHSSAKGAVIRGSKIAAGRYVYPAHTDVRSHASPSEQILSIVRGKAKYRVGEEEKVLGPGEAVLVRANTEYSAQILEELEVIGFQDVRPAAERQEKSRGSAFFRWDEMQSDFITPKYSSGRGPVVTGDQIEVAFMFYPGGTEAKPHSHPNEQIQVGLKGKVKYIIGGEEHISGAEGGVLMPVDVPHSVSVLEDYTVINCKDIVQGFSVYHARWEK
jgi:quercetin dioxygenase-like cupin family protein